MAHGLFAQHLTGNCYSCLPLDIWIVMTKGSKINVGWKNILKNKENVTIAH